MGTRPATADQRPPLDAGAASDGIQRWARQLGSGLALDAGQHVSDGCRIAPHVAK
jgi:hypothetical protein